MHPNIKHLNHHFLAKLGKWLNVEFFVERFLPGGKKMMNKLKLDYAAPRTLCVF
jgi:hypothetical protein